MFGRREMAEVADLQRSLYAMMNYLQRLAESRQIKRSAQNVLMRNLPVDGSPHSLRIEGRSQVNAVNIVEDGRIRTVFAMKDHSGLELAQRVGVFDLVAQSNSVGFRYKAERR